MADSLADSRYAASLARPLAGFELLLNAAVGFTWGPLLFHFLLRIADWTRPVPLLLMAGTTLGLGFLGARAPAAYFRLRQWERVGGGHVYVRYFGIRTFKRWMSHGDLMNAWLRRRIPRYRVVRPGAAAAAAYATRTVHIERAHLAWGLAALAILAYARLPGLTVSRHSGCLRTRSRTPGRSLSSATTGSGPSESVAACARTPDRAPRIMNLR